MRILSQDGLPIRDFPYEKTYLYVEENRKKIKALFDGIIFDIAEYSTESKAKNAMEMLQFCYKEHVTEMVYHEGSCYIHPCFQFPADDEIKE